MATRATSPADTGTTTTLIRRAEAERRADLSRATVYRLTAKGLFPRPVQLSARRVAFRLADVDAWIASRVSTVSA